MGIAFSIAFTTWNFEEKGQKHFQILLGCSSFQETSIKERAMLEGQKHLAQTVHDWIFKTSAKCFDSIIHMDSDTFQKLQD